jgi:hypothetical protein
MEPRKASEVLLELEAKIDTLMSIVRTQDLNIKILSNKVNSLIEKTGQIEAVSPIAQQPTARIEAVDLTKEQISVSPDNILSVEKEPKGFRRTSRPETFAGDNTYLNKPDKPIAPKFPMQLPKAAEAVIPQKAFQTTTFTEIPNSGQQSDVPQNLIPVIQRVVDKNGKSVFLADVEIINTENLQTISKIKTNGAGKWMVSLLPGEYRVFIRKREAINKDRLEISQVVNVDGNKSPLELQMVILK